MPHKDVNARRAYHRKWCAANREKTRGYQRVYRRRHKVSIRKSKADYAKRNRVRYQGYWRAWAEKNPDKAAANSREYRAIPANKEKRRVSARRWAGMPEPTRPCPKYCECCGRKQNGQALCLDHCHNTGKFRGWICRQCNTGIGMLGDTLAAIHLAAKYLRKTK